MRLLSQYAYEWICFIVYFQTLLTPKLIKYLKVLSV